MNDKMLQEFETLIHERLAELDHEDALGEAGQATVELDQQAVGRLSRMDALQNQAMAKANHARRQIEKGQLQTTLQRIADNDFGYCEECGDEIATGRLRLNPVAIKCVECASG